MISLFLDTSSSNLNVGVLKDKKLLKEKYIHFEKDLSKYALNEIKELLDSLSLKPNDIDNIYCVNGPGSFTGLRIGIATIKGFALSLNKKVIAVPTLVGLAYNISYFDGIICSVLDARNDNVYAALFKFDGKPKMIENYFTDSVDALIENLKEKNEKVIFVGDGAVNFREKFENALGEKAYFAPLHLNETLSTSIAKAALDKASFEEFDTCDTLTPLYLKKSQAEREAEEKSIKKD